MILNLKDLKPADVQNYLQHAVAPRPICFASTIDKKGNVNLSPFSFFNLFSSNPPVVIFSPSRKVRDNTTKHTLQNVLEIPETVINIVDYAMVQQTSLASCEFPKGVNEFEKAGFTMQPATVVKPPMVKESKIKMECKVLEVKPLGTEGGAGNLVICEVLVMHNLFKVEIPNTQLGIGVDALPPAIKNSKILSGNNLGQLGNVHEMPFIDPAFHDDKLKNIFQYYSLNPEDMERELHIYAKELLGAGKVKEAWQVLLVLN
jgi:flavin reductase (DIM6/NTAB) family NADH-FMN oxidoreductase RutF